MAKWAKLVRLVNFALWLIFVVPAHGQPSQCAAPPPNLPPATISPAFPADVCIPASSAGVPFAFFDDFSWRTFVAAVWPSLTQRRGLPDITKSVGDTNSALVFETYKADWEVFQPNGAAPASWEESGPAIPCANVPVPKVGFNDLVLSSFSKFGHLGQAGFGDLVGPLVAQNTTYTLFLAAFNRVEFDQIVANKWYLRANLKQVDFKPDSLTNSPIDMKSSWVVVRNNVPDPKRYYTRKAFVLDLPSGKCTDETVALVGLHLVTKTPSRPQWIWSTFEHVDNVPGSGAQPPLGFNSGDGKPMPAKNPIGFPPPISPPAAFNVTRVFPISASTQQTNAAYRAELASRGSGVWQFYQLVMTQWPVQGNAPKNPGSPAFTFPGNNPTTAFSNTTMETFDQKRIQQGCMNCHTLANAGPATDFLWALQINAFPPVIGTNASQPQFHSVMKSTTSVPLQKLKTLLKNANTPFK